MPDPFYRIKGQHQRCLNTFLVFYYSVVGDSVHCEEGKFCDLHNFHRNSLLVSLTFTLTSEQRFILTLFKYSTVQPIRMDAWGVVAGFIIT